MRKMRNYDLIYNKGEYLMDSRLSLKAKGIMALIIGYINKEQPRILKVSDLREFCCDGVVSFNNAIKELETLGYINKRICRNGFDESPWFYNLKE